MNNEAKYFEILESQILKTDMWLRQYKSTEFI